ncbi:MAG: sugar ABC transporter permease [Proteobacteria bacterium]|nr:sugar ABC transporter permease [Pseudomonadota bacterium]
MRRPSWLLRLFLGLPMIYLLAMIGVPIVYNLAMSVQEVTLGNIAAFARPFVGLDNFTDSLADPIFRRVLHNSVVFVLVNVAGQVGIGTIAAACFAGGFPGASTMRGLLLAAWILPGLVVGTVWKWMFATQFGVVNFVLSALGLIGTPVHWLSDPATSMTALNIAHIWFGIPFSMILVAAALTNIPGELYEAASLDGAGPLRRFRYITLPAIAPALFAVACLVAIASLRAFDVIFALTQGGPLNSTNVLPLLSYQASFQDFEFGRGAAIGSFAFVMVFGVALVYVRTLKSEQPA